MAKRKKGKPSLLAIIIFIVIALLGVKETGLVEIDNSKLTNSRLDGEVYVHFIDVGQGSSTLIQQGKNGILIDSGLADYGDTVSDFIKSCGVTDLEYVIKGMNINGNYYIPTFYYEFVWCLIGFVILMLLRYLWKKYNTGQLTGFYLLWYGIGRLYIESLRTDSLMLGNIKIAQLISILFIVSGFVIFFWSIIIGLIKFIIEYVKKKKDVGIKSKAKKNKQG
jgi:hypothetical protein